MASIDEAFEVAKKIHHSGPDDWAREENGSGRERFAHNGGGAWQRRRRVWFALRHDWGCYGLRIQPSYTELGDVSGTNYTTIIAAMKRMTKPGA